MLILDPRSTALVLIDLQNGIIGTPLAPRLNARMNGGIVHLPGWRWRNREL
jgi:hypothetical protein